MGSFAKPSAAGRLKEALQGPTLRPFAIACAWLKSFRKKFTSQALGRLPCYSRKLAFTPGAGVLQRLSKY